MNEIFFFYDPVLFFADTGKSLDFDLCPLLDAEFFRVLFNLVALPTYYPNRFPVYLIDLGNSILPVFTIDGTPCVGTYLEFCES